MSIVAWGRAAMRRGMLITAAAEIFLYHYCVLIRDFSTIQSTEGDLRQPSESQNVSPYWETPPHPGASGRVRFATTCPGGGSTERNNGGRL
jgi:hypothetical protein